MDLCSHGQVVRLTGRESDTGPNLESCSMLFFVCLFVCFFPLTASYTCNLLARKYMHMRNRTGDLGYWPDVFVTRIITPTLHGLIFANQMSFGR